MATSQKLQEDLLTCQICFDVYQQPCTLHCGHTYCKACLTRYIQIQSDGIKTKTIPCPSCRRHITVPHPDRPVTDWAGQFKPGLVIQGLMDSFCHSNTEIEICSVCKEEGETAPATHWCTECEASLCELCLKYHNKMPTSRHHCVSDLTGENCHVNVKKKQFMCKEHDKKMKLFCKDCRKTLCTICCNKEHRSCKQVVTMQVMLPEVKQELTDMRKTVMDEIKKRSSNITECKLKGDNITAKITKVKTKIRKTIQNAVDLLIEKEVQLLDKVDDITDKQTEELRAKVKCEEIMIQMYQQQSQFIQQALKIEDETQLYEMYLSSGSVTDITETDTKNRPNVADISFIHNMEKVREDIVMMDVMAVCDDIIDLTATPVLEEIVDMKREDDQYKPDLRDVVILHKNGINTAVVTDYNNKNIKSFYRTRRKSCSSQMKTDDLPWSLAVLNQNKVVVSVPHSKQILTAHVSPSLVLQSTISTIKKYYGLSVLDQSTLVAGSDSPPSVDILDMTGNVLRSFTTLTSIQRSFKVPNYLHITHEGNILVSDWGLKSVICLTPTGEVVFHYSPTGDRKLVSPSGITSIPGGDILLTDYNTHKVIHLTQSGEYVQDILTAQNGLQDPIGVCVDGDKLYIGTLYRGLRVFNFSQNK